MDDVIEGIVHEKHVDRILQRDALERIVHDLTKEGQEINFLVTKKAKELVETQEQLQQVTLSLAVTQEKLGELKKNEKAGLSQEDLLKCHAVCQNVLRQFFVDNAVATRNLKVEVLYHSGGATGKAVVAGGSNLCVFQVDPSETILSLQNQAAKYWGLEQEIVFFLDREGQLIPDSMLLGEIVLPAGSDYLVSQFHYRFTLAKTELVVVDMLAPKGHKWRDFSFNHPYLKEQLALHRKLRGQASLDLDPVDPSKIPTLAELIERGTTKRRKAIFDLQCRIVEFGCFAVVLVLLYFF
eukprot:g5872.t1